MFGSHWIFQIARIAAARAAGAFFAAHQRPAHLAIQDTAGAARYGYCRDSKFTFIAVAILGVRRYGLGRQCAPTTSDLVEGVRQKVVVRAGK